MVVGMGIMVMTTMMVYEVVQTVQSQHLQRVDSKTGEAQWINEKSGWNFKHYVLKCITFLIIIGSSAPFSGVATIWIVIRKFGRVKLCISIGSKGVGISTHHEELVVVVSLSQSLPPRVGKALMKVKEANEM